MGLRAWAPGRVNLIGDHTDYMGGLALPMAIGLGTEITGDRGGNWVMLGSDGFEGVAEVPVHGVDDPAPVEPPWARYVAAVVDEVRPTDGLVGMVHSTLPPGSGLASSAALEVAVATALGADRVNPVAAAKACQRAEERAVGVPCGIMDQLVSLAAIEGMALRIDCDTLELENVPFPDDAEVVVIHSGRHRDLATSAYAQRAGRCEAEQVIGRLREASPIDAEAIDDPVLRRRARHVTTENERVDALAGALAKDQPRLRGRAARGQPRQHARRLRGVDARAGRGGGRRAWRARRVRGPGHRCRVRRLRGHAVPAEDPHRRPAVVWRGRPAAGASLATT